MSESRFSTHHSSLITHYFSYSFNNRTGRGAFDEGEREHAAARRLDLFAPVNLIESVVAALDEHVGQHFRDERARAEVVEDRHVIHRAERREHLRTLALAHHGAPRAFQLAHR